MKVAVPDRIGILELGAMDRQILSRLCDEPLAYRSLAVLTCHGAPVNPLAAQVEMFTELELLLRWRRRRTGRSERSTSRRIAALFYSIGK